MDTDAREAGAAPERFPPLAPERMTAEQRRVAEAIAGGPRGGLRGPFSAWLRSPELADLLQKVGEKVRFRASLPAALNELAILVTARAWTSQFEWYAHRRLALEAGLAPAIVEAIAAGRRPDGMGEAERAAYEFALELHRDRNVSDPTFAAALARFGEAGVIELIAACGYYTLVSMTLNVSRVPLPPDAAPLPPLERPLPPP
ncbi:carboxymuconolactone decarboxylase family protein [Roseomonas sp. NAR14]|uniref:Carboxymuconolactone decarboxylase family protein n=1 Tax=Roseomonas acroporae TaxID=2937791 RepID=A0A9X1Y943_9PROT|nr:carboxymuconolactone decarboxylase family protein [Roseomonas acroporae]MCK8785706.1 carboxymuconolactone decarboxylase family protein [Roseomonas acroporae]